MVNLLPRTHVVLRMILSSDYLAHDCRSIQLTDARRSISLQFHFNLAHTCVAQTQPLENGFCSVACSKERVCNVSDGGTSEHEPLKFN